MQYKAIIFDLFGTIVDSFSLTEYNHLISQLSSVLSIPSEKFSQMWYKTSKQRGTGVFKTIEECIKYICRALNTQVSEEKIKKCVQLRLESTKRAMKPKTEALETIIELKKKELKIGLISNCSAEVPKLWENSSFYPLFDATIFSCSAGLKKPDRKIYKLMCEHLKLKPQDCLYIGDGDSNELEGASQVGMAPIRIRDLHDEDPYLLTKIKWNGDEISTLKEILNYL